MTGRKTASCMLIGILLLQADGESKSAAESKAVGRPRLSSTGHVYAGLSDEEVEVSLNLRQTMSGTGLGGIQNITSYNGSTDIPCFTPWSDSRERWIDVSCHGKHVCPVIQ